MAIYYEETSGALLRRADGSRDLLPDEVLWPEGWTAYPGSVSTSFDPFPGPPPTRRGCEGGGGDPNLLITTSVISEAQAKRIARSRGLPATGW